MQFFYIIFAVLIKYILPTFTVTVNNHTKFQAKLNPRLNYNNFLKFKMAALRYLGFVTSPYRNTHEVCSLVHIGLSNFMLIRCIVLKIWRLIFCRFGLKCLFTPPKFWSLGVWTPKGDWSSTTPPKGTSLAGTALTCQFCRIFEPILITKFGKKLWPFGVRKGRTG